MTIAAATCSSRFEGGAALRRGTRRRRRRAKVYRIRSHCGRVKLVVDPRMEQGRKGDRGDEVGKGGRGPRRTDGRRTDRGNKMAQWEAQMSRGDRNFALVRACKRDHSTAETSHTFRLSNRHGWPELRALRVREMRSGGRIGGY